jgi:hypothetical protein
VPRTSPSLTAVAAGLVKPADMQMWRSATSHISRFTEIHSASASTRPQGLRKPAPVSRHPYVEGGFEVKKKVVDNHS